MLFEDLLQPCKYYSKLKGAVYSPCITSTFNSSVGTIVNWSLFAFKFFFCPFGKNSNLGPYFKSHTASQIQSYIPTLASPHKFSTLVQIFTSQVKLFFSSVGLGPFPMILSLHGLRQYIKMEHFKLFNSIYCKHTVIIQCLKDINVSAGTLQSSLCCFRLVIPTRKNRPKNEFHGKAKTIFIDSSCNNRILQVFYLQFNALERCFQPFLRLWQT